MTQQSTTEHAVRIGEQLADEPLTFTDERTGATIHQLTTHASINHGLFFLNPSFRPGANQLAFATHRAGFAQLCLFDFDKRTSVCLTDRADLAAFSASFDPSGQWLYYTTQQGDTQQSEVRRVHADTFDDEPIASLTGAGLGECALSADGTHLVTACKRGATHGLFVIDLESRQGQVVFETDALKIIHPQFDPADPTRIEYAGDPAPRLWMIRRDGADNRCVYPSTADEFYVHESFLGQSSELIFAVWPYRLCRMHPDRDETPRTILQLNTWHMSSNRDGTRIVSDTAHPDRGLLLIDPDTGEYSTLCHPNSSNQGSQWLRDHPAGADVWAQQKGEDGKALSWMEMKADTVYGPQWTHPHPAFDPNGERIVYTSDRTGYPQVYVVELPRDM